MRLEPLLSRCGGSTVVGRSPHVPCGGKARAVAAPWTAQALRHVGTLSKPGAARRATRQAKAGIEPALAWAQWDIDITGCCAKCRQSPAKLAWCRHRWRALRVYTTPVMPSPAAPRAASLGSGSGGSPRAEHP